MIEKKKKPPSSPPSLDRCRRADYSIERVTSVTSPDSSWFSENRKPARPLEAWYVYPVIPGWPLFPFRFDRRRVGGEGRSRKQLERRWRLHETAEALEEIPSSGGGIESIGKEERPSTNNRGSPPFLSSPRIEIRFSAEEPVDLPPKSWNRSPYDGLFSRGRFKMLQ